MSDTKSSKLYFHISNSGFSFSVEDNGSGPELVVFESVFGHRMLESRMMTTREGLMALGSFLSAQGARTFSEPYCHATSQPELLGMNATDDHALHLRLAQEYGGIPSKKHIAAFVRAGQDECARYGSSPLEPLAHTQMAQRRGFSSEPSTAEVAGVADDLKRLAPKPVPHCCALGCGAVPMWSVHTGKGLAEDYTHACNEHLASLCDLHQPSTVARLPSMADPSSDRMNTGKAR